jgi:hypothetical protein
MASSSPTLVGEITLYRRRRSIDLIAAAALPRGGAIALPNDRGPAALKPFTAVETFGAIPVAPPITVPMVTGIDINADAKAAIASANEDILSRGWNSESQHADGGCN